MTKRQGHTYEFARKAMMVDMVVCGVVDGRENFCRTECLTPAEMAADRLPKVYILLIERKGPTFKGYWALPGAHCKAVESFEEAAERRLEETTGLKNVPLTQFHTFSKRGRDPREPTGTVAFYTLIRAKSVEPEARWIAQNARWFPVNELPKKLAFDHREIITKGLACMRESLWKTPILANVLPPKFTLGQLHAVYEQVRGEPIDKSNFRRDYLKLGFLEELREVDTAVSHRPPKLYRFQKGEI